MRQTLRKMTPGEASNKRYELSVEYARLSELLEPILIRKALYLPAAKEEMKSDAAALRKWAATEDGINELKLTMATKRNEKLSQGLSAIIRLKENEAKGIW